MKPALALALLLAACASQPGPDEWEESASRSADGTVGWLDGQEITYAEVGKYLRSREPETFFRMLEGMLEERVARMEARVTGVEIEEASLNRETNRTIHRWEERVRTAAKARTGKEIEPAVWLQRVAGLSMAQFRGQVRRQTEVEMLIDRLLRYELLTSPSVEVSILVVRDLEEAKRLKQQVADGGAEFALLARQHSNHATAPAGGRIDHLLVRADFNDPEVRQAVFRAAPGEVVGPFATRGGDEVWQQLYRIEAAHEGRQEAWERLKGEVLESLRKRPPSDGEYERWRRRILLRHGFAAAPVQGDTG